MSATPPEMYQRTMLRVFETMLERQPAWARMQVRELLILASMPVAGGKLVAAQLNIPLREFDYALTKLHQRGFIILRLPGWPDVRRTGDPRRRGQGLYHLTPAGEALFTLPGTKTAQAITTPDTERSTAALTLTPTLNAER